MTELELTRTRHDRRLYALEGVGTLRLEGLFSRSAAAEAGAETWHFARRGFWQRGMDATDSGGAVVGEFQPREIRRGGMLSWAGRELTLHPVSLLRERYALSDGGRDLVLLDGRSWGRHPVRISMADAAAVEPGLLLFTAFVVHRLAVDSANNASAGTTAALSGTYSGG
jgi:hypothetical protein